MNLRSRQSTNKAISRLAHVYGNGRPGSGAIVALYTLTLAGLIGGWIVVLGAGFHTQLGKHGGPAVFIDGAAAAVMATLQLLLAAIGASAIVQVHVAAGKRLRWHVICSLLVLAPPLLVALTS